MSKQPSRWQDQPEDLWQLLGLTCDNQAGPADIARLEAILQSDKSAQDLYLAYLEIHAKLQWRYREESSSPAVSGAEGSKVEGPIPAIPLPPARPFALPLKSPVLGFLASVSRHVPGGEFTVGSLLLLVIVAAFWGLSQAILFPRLGGHDLAQESPHPPTVPPSHRSESVATIRESSEVEWSEASAPRLTDSSTSRGEPIAANQPLSIQSGLIELELKQGTTLLIEGPADWKIDGENSATLTHGKLVAKVPQQAIGFTLETPNARIIDLGTEFGVEVAKDGAADVHVSKGIVDVQSAGGSSKPGPGQLKAGQSARITEAGATVETNAGLPDKFKRLVEAGNKEPAALATNPTAGLVSYYPFDGDTRDHAAEYAAHSGKASDDLTINGPSQFLAGQVGKGLRLTGGYAAAPFSPDVQLPPTFTIEAWIVAERLTPTYQRMLLNWGGNPAALVYHFSIKDKGMELGVGQADGTIVRAEGGELKIERWQHVAGVADGSKLHVYIGGEEVAVRDFGGTLFPNQEEGLGVGDSASGDAPTIRLHGAIDELAIWSVALSPEQIAFHARRGTRGYELSPHVKTATTTSKIEK